MNATVTYEDFWNVKICIKTGSNNDFLESVKKGNFS